MVVKNGVEFEALDDEPVTLLFLIAAPNTEDNIHLDVLSKLSVMLMDDNFTESLRNAGSVDEFMEIIDKADEEKKDIDERLADTGSSEGARAKLLAVTSCPTGIAHTYMAAEGLEKAAKAKDCFIKIETRGSGGAKNVLTDQEIREADCIIVAADAKVPMDRFDGKKSSNVRFQMESAKRTGLLNVRFPEMFRYIMQQQAVRALPQMQKQAAEQATRSICS